MEVDIDSAQKSDTPFVERFEEFFNQEYKKQIEKLVENYPEEKSLVIDYKRLEKFYPALADEILIKPDEILLDAAKAAKNIHIPTLLTEPFEPFIRISNLPRDRESNIKDVGSKSIGKLVCVEGLVRQITDVLPQLTMAAWKCTRCGNIYKKEQERNKIKSPGFCECRNKEYELLEDESTFKDYQKVQIQEPIEKLKGNEQATYIDVYVTDDMVNKLTAGDKTKFVGILRLKPPEKDKKTVYGKFIDANFFEQTEKEFSEVEVSREEEEEIKRLATDPEIYELLTRSIAPTIYGHDIVKQSIALQLFGGVTKTFLDKENIRGNIHILLVGDPGCGKSQILLASKNIAPKSIYVSGKTTSGVGLTASAVKDEFGEGGWTLKAGALVLSSGGTCMADELDKMANEDRSALHEAMEQGMISVAKAGIVTRFKADTSLLAAANPKYSRFDKNEPIFQQIELPASLISRFDLFFTIKDIMDKEKDSAIAGHILTTHESGERMKQYASKGKNLTKEQLAEIDVKTKPAINPDILRKYISYARQKCFPILTEEAKKEITDFYVNLRDLGRKDNTYTATARQLEGLIRLAEASARVRLSDFVEKDDANRSINLVRKSLEETVVDPTTGKIDIDLMTSGVSHSKQNDIKTILNFLREESVKGTDSLQVEDLIEVMKEKGLDEERVVKALEEMDKKGDIYKPRHNLVKLAQKR